MAVLFHNITLGGSSLLQFQYVLWLLACIVGTGLFLWSLGTWWRLRHIPGPFFASTSNFQRVWWVKTGQAHLHHQRVHEKYGDVVRIGPNMVSISNPEAIPIIYPMRTGFPKSDFYGALRAYTRGRGTMLAVFNTQDEDMHKRIKNPIAPLFSLSRAVSLEGVVDEVLGCFAHQIDTRFSPNREVFDLGEWIQFFAFDAMGTMSFSRRYGLLDQGKDVDRRVETIFEYMKAAAPMTQIPWLDWCINKNRIAHSFRRTPGMSIMGYVGKTAGERLKDESKHSSRKDFLDHYLEIQRTNPEIPAWAPLAWTFSNVIAGSDPVGTVTRTVMCMDLSINPGLNNLLSNPSTLERLRNELLTTDLSKPCPKWAEVSGLPFLDACIQEGLRLYPPFCLPLERVIPPGGITLLGKYLPGGTIVGGSPYVVNRYKAVFGEDSELWRPERWLEGGEEHRRQLDKSLLSFGAGRRVCLGKHFGILELKKLVSFLIINYDMELVDPNLFTVENAWVLKQRGLYARIAKRS